MVAPDYDGQMVGDYSHKRGPPSKKGLIYSDGLLLAQGAVTLFGIWPMKAYLDSI